MKNVHIGTTCPDTGARAISVGVADGPTRLAQLQGTYDIEGGTAHSEGGHR